MKKLILALCLCTFSVLAHSQFYVSPSFSYYNGTGEFKDKGMVTLEVGKTFKETVSVGLAGGVLNFRDYTPYAELRTSTAIVTNKNISVLGVLGAGYVFQNSPQNLMVEYGGTVNIGLSKHYVFSFSGGAYKFNGRSSSSTASYVGTGVTYIFN